VYVSVCVFCNPLSFFSTCESLTNFSPPGSCSLPLRPIQLLFLIFFCHVFWWLEISFMDKWDDRLRTPIPTYIMQYLIVFNYYFSSLFFHNIFIIQIYTIIINIHYNDLWLNLFMFSIVYTKGKIITNYTRSI
jgi:hypothetical protein